MAELEVKCEKKIEGLAKLAIEINQKYMIFFYNNDLIMVNCDLFLKK